MAADNAKQRCKLQCHETLTSDNIKVYVKLHISCTSSCTSDALSDAALVRSHLPASTHSKRITMHCSLARVIELRNNGKLDIHIHIHIHIHSRFHSHILIHILRLLILIHSILADLHSPCAAISCNGSWLKNCSSAGSWANGRRSARSVLACMAMKRCGRRVRRRRSLDAFASRSSSSAPGLSTSVLNDVAGDMCSAGSNVRARLV